MIIKTVKQHLSRSPYQSLAAILVVCFAFFVIAVFTLLGIGSGIVLHYFESRPQISAFLKDEIKPQEIELMKAKLVGTGKVKSITYFSKEDALKIYKEQNKDKPLLLEMVTAKILPASLEISTNELSSLKEIAQELKKEPMVEDVIFQEDVITALSKWTATVKKIGLVLGVFLLLISVLTILVVLGMKISQRKEEIEILKLLGASSWDICSPFYLEGIFYGVISAIFSWGFSYIALLYATPFLVSFLGEIPIFPIPFLFMAEILGGLMILGIVVGFTGSILAMARFIRSTK